MAHPLTPCAVIVDVRNVHGQSGSVFNDRRRPTADSIKATLQMYGFDVVEIFAGVATETKAKTPSDALRHAISSNQNYAKDLRADGVTVLEGQLSEHPQPNGSMKIDEKKVDVYLALRVADLTHRINQGDTAYRHVIVLSEDMDLIPAYEYAAERGVLVYAAAFDTIHHRDEQVKWLVLHEAALDTLVKLNQHLLIAETRAYLARAAVRSIQPAAIRWKAMTPQGKGTVTLVNNRGIRGTWNSPASVRRGDRFDLYAAEVKLPDTRGRFPILTLSTKPPSDPSTPMRNTEGATVEHWTSPTRMSVRLDSGAAASLDVSPGAALVGDRVAVMHPPAGKKTARHFIGPVTTWTAPTGWSDPTPFQVAVVSGQKSRRLLAATTDAGDDVLIHSSLLDHAALGSRILVAAVGVDSATGAIETMPVTCCLPPV